MSKLLTEQLINIGADMKSYREEKNISQKGLGRRLGVSDKSIGGYENRYRFPPVPMILKFLELKG